MTSVSAGPARSRRRGRSELSGDLVTLAAAAAFVQVVFPDRVDLASHVVAGAGLALIVAAVAPTRLRPRIAVVSMATCLAVAVVVELVQPGVLDHGDIAYTGVGSLLVARSTLVVSQVDRRRRVASVLLGLMLITGGLVFRYG